MKKPFYAVLVAFGCLAPVFPVPGGEKEFAKDLKALQGLWRGWVVEGKGDKDKGIINLEILVKDDTMTAKQLGNKEGPLGQGTFRFSLDGSQKIIDATRTSTPGKGQVYKGIFSLEGDTFKWCTSNPNGERPKDLISKRGQFLLVLKKVKS